MFEEYTYETLLNKMLNKVDSKLDKREGSVIFDALAPIALLLADFYVDMGMVLDETSAESASYYYLIKRTAERGVLPKEETKAICKMIVTPAAVPISVGDRFNLNALNYSVVSVIDEKSGEYQVECEEAGIAGNQQLGMLIPIETQNELNDMESAELTEILIPGEEDEDVDDFRERYFSSLNSEAFGGNKTDYEEKVNSIDGVGGCKVKRAWKGDYRPSDMIPNSSVSDWFQEQSEVTLGSEIYSWLQVIYNAAIRKLLTVGGTVKVVIITSELKPPSSTLINTVQEILDPTMTAGEGDGCAPIGHVVNVTGVQNTVINIDTNITYADGYSYTNLKESIEDIIDSYFFELKQNWAASDNIIIRISQIESRLLSVEGIEDISDTKINGNGNNLILDDENIPIRGEISG